MGEPSDRAAKLVARMDSKPQSWEEWFVNGFLDAADEGARYADTKDFCTFHIKAPPQPMDVLMATLAPEIKSIADTWEIKLYPSLDHNDVLCRSMSMEPPHPMSYKVVMKRRVAEEPACAPDDLVANVL